MRNTLKLSFAEIGHLNSRSIWLRAPTERRPASVAPPEQTPAAEHGADNGTTTTTTTDYYYFFTRAFHAQDVDDCSRPSQLRPWRRTRRLKTSFISSSFNKLQECDDGTTSACRRFPRVFGEVRNYLKSRHSAVCGQTFFATIEEEVTIFGLKRSDVETPNTSPVSTCQSH